MMTCDSVLLLGHPVYEKIVIETRTRKKIKNWI